jgi:outer membrane protein assembly factor BamB
MRIGRAWIACCAGVLLAAGVAAAENWPQWRGPLLNGSTTETDLPTKFSPTENVTWVAEVPAAGGATPIVWDDRVLLAAQEREEGHKLWAICLGRSDGKVLWKHPMGTGFANRMGNTGASASPITDGQTAWFFYGTGDLAAFDMDGKVIWQRNIAKDHGRFEMLWDYGGTPLLYKGKLYLAVIHGRHDSSTPAPSYLLCMDPKTGKDLWKTVRDNDAVGESRQAFITPVPYEGPGGPQILLTGGDHLTGHDVNDGKCLWQSSTYNPTKNRWWRTVPSPAACGEAVIGCAPKGGQLFAVRAVDGEGQKAGSDLWVARYNSPDVCTPLVYKGRFYVLDGDKKVMVCMEPKTGQVVWKGELGGKAVFQASATGADGKAYCINLNGEVFVVSLGEKFELLHRVEFGGSPCRSTIVAAGGQLFIRTDAKLYCIGKRRGGA